MPINALIPLQSQAPHFMGPQDVISLQNLAMQNQMGQVRLQEAIRATKEANAVREILKGGVNENTLAQVMAVSPRIGSQLAKDLATVDWHKAQTLNAQRQGDLAAQTMGERSRQEQYRNALINMSGLPTENEGLARFGVTRAPDGSLQVTNPSLYATASKGVETPDQPGAISVNTQNPQVMEQLRMGAIPLSQLGSYLRTPSNNFFTAGGRVFNRQTGQLGPVQPPERPQPINERLVKDPSSETGWSWEDARTLKRRLGAPPPTNASQVQSGVNPDNADLHGEDYIKTLPNDIQNSVRALISYQAPLNSFSTRTGERRMLLEHAKQADPNFNAAKYAVRQGVMTEFTRGVAARNVTAINTAIGHMGTMATMAEALNNGDLRSANAVGNEIMTQLGRPERNNYELAMVAVSDELMRVFRQVGANQAEAQRWEERMKAAGSPEQLRGALRVGMELLQSRIDALDNQWKRGMESEKGFPGLLDPKSVEALAAIRKGSSTNPSLPSNEAIESELRRRGLK